MLHPENGSIAHLDAFLARKINIGLLADGRRLRLFVVPRLGGAHSPSLSRPACSGFLPSYGRWRSAGPPDFMPVLPLTCAGLFLLREFNLRLHAHGPHLRRNFGHFQWRRFDQRATPNRWAGRCWRAAGIGLLLKTHRRRNPPAAPFWFSSWSHPLVFQLLLRPLHRVRAL